LIGAYFFSHRIEWHFNLKEVHNETVSIFLSLSGVFFGITLGLIAVGTFENYNSAEATAVNESSMLNALYRDVSILENYEKEKLQKTLRYYTKYTINEAWPEQKNGIISHKGTLIMNRFQKEFSNYRPVNDKDKILYAEVFNQFNALSEARRLRINAVNTALPSTIWIVLKLGALINLMLTWFLVIKNRKLEISMNILISLLLGSLIFLIAIMDNPFRGEYSVSSDSFQLLLDGVMRYK
jgi:hypothetical protein